MGIGKLLLAATAMLIALPAAAQVAASVPAAPRTVLFIGNSFTFGAHSAAWRYRADTIADLNGDGIGGVPALFKLLTEEAGLDYRVSAETSPGKSLEWHWQNKRDLVDRAWDHVVLQEYSTLDREKPGDATKLVDYSSRFAAMFTARNPAVAVSLTATWSRPDLVYPSGAPWSGTAIAQMARDVRRGYDRAAGSNPAIARVDPVGEAFTCAIEAGVADPNPYDGIAFGQANLWAYDHYHASSEGYYLEALTIFIGITGRDPRAFGKTERAASELGIAPDAAARLQAVAWAATHGSDCAALAPAEAAGPG